VHLAHRIAPQREIRQIHQVPSIRKFWRNFASPMLEHAPRLLICSANAARHRHGGVWPARPFVYVDQNGPVCLKWDAVGADQNAFFQWAAVRSLLAESGQFFPTLLTSSTTAPMRLTA
jgi:hypothetical protein